MKKADTGEIFDLVSRKGPLSLRALMDQISAYSEDSIVLALEELVENGQVEQRAGNLETDGTTADVYVAQETE